MTKLKDQNGIDREIDLDPKADANPPKPALEILYVCLVCDSTWRAPTQCCAKRTQPHWAHRSAHFRSITYFVDPSTGIESLSPSPESQVLEGEEAQERASALALEPEEHASNDDSTPNNGGRYS